MARQVIVDIVGDSSKFNKSVNDATNTTKSGFGTIGSVIAGAAGGAITFGIEKIVEFGGTVLEQGPKLQAMAAKAATVFGDQLSVVKTWASESAHAMGLTSNEATGLAANFADLLIPMGFSREQAAKMSTDVIGLSGALSEWSGGTKSAAEVSEILSKAMLGERDGLKGLGISISEADVQNQLLKDGTSKLTGAQLDQAKATATQELIFAKSTDAQTAFAKGTAEGIRQQNEMKARLGEVTEKLITALYPILISIGDVLGNVLPPILDVVTTALGILGPIVQQVADAITPIVTNIMQALKPAFQWLSGFMTSTLMPIFKTVIGVLSQVVGWIGERIPGVINFLKPIVSSLATGIRVAFDIIGGAIKIVWDVVQAFGKVWSTVFNGVSSVIKTVGSTINTVFTAAGSVVKRIWDGIAQAVKGAVNIVIGVINGIIRGINSFQVHVHLDTPLGNLGFDWNGLNLRYLPYLHQGGIVPGSPGSDVLAILQAGERVVPRADASGDRPINIYIDGSVYGDLDQLARDLAFRLRTVGA